VSQYKVAHFYFIFFGDILGKSGPIFIFFTVKFRKELRRTLKLKLSPPLKSVAALSGQLYSFTAVNSVQLQSDARR